MKNTKKTTFPYAIPICFLLALLLLFFFLFGIKNSPVEEPEVLFDETRRQQAVKSQTEYEKNYYEIIPQDMELFYKYREKNADVVGIITIRDSILRHPIMQSPDKGESFYLSHDLDGNHNFHGVPFLTLKSDLLKETGCSLIYGHNIIHTEPNDVFCDLVHYEDLEYYKSHPVIEVVTEKGTCRYLIFSYAIMDTSDSDAFVYWEGFDFETDAEFNAYMEEMERRNWLDVGIERTRYDSYLTISTCSLELAHSGTNRMVVMGKKIAVGEDINKYVSSSTMRKNPLLPEKLRDQ